MSVVTLLAICQGILGPTLLMHVTRKRLLDEKVINSLSDAGLDIASSIKPIQVKEFRYLNVSASKKRAISTPRQKEREESIPSQSDTGEQLNNCIHL